MKLTEDLIESIKLLPQLIDAFFAWFVNKHPVIAFILMVVIPFLICSYIENL